MSKSKMVKFIRNIVIVLLAGYIFFCMVLFFKQKEFIYFPTVTDQSLKTEILKNTNVKEIVLDNGEQSLRGYYVIKNSKKIIIYFGGNGEDVGYDVYDFLQNKVDADFVTFNYPGYSESVGELSEKKIFADAIEIVKYVKQNYPEKKIYIVGRSLGSGVASYLSGEENIAGIVLVTPYDSLLNISKKVFWFVPVNLLLTEKYESIECLDTNKKYLVMYAEGDQVVPNENTLNLLKYLNMENTIVVKFKDVDHNTISADPKYWETLQEFINSVNL